MRIVFLLLFFPGILSAQHTDKDTLVTDLETVTLSATRFAEKTMNVPQKVHHISAGKIATLNQPTSAEMLNQTGAVLIQKSQAGGGSPVIRGFEANKVLLVVDGVRMNNAVYRGGHLQNVITIDASILDKTEILFGPSSVMYGSDALGGVISFFTRQPKYSEKRFFISPRYMMRYSSAYDEKTQHIDFNIGTKKLASLTSFTYSDFGSLQQGRNRNEKYGDWGKRIFTVQRINGTDSMIKNPSPHKQVESGYKQYDMLQKFRFNIKKTEQNINLQYSTSTNINRYDRLTEINTSGIARSAEWYYGPQERLLASWNMRFNSGIGKANIIAAYQSIEESRHNRNYRSEKLNHRTENIKVYTLNTDFRKDIKGFEINYGAEFTANKVASSAYFENIVTGEKGLLDTRYPDGGSRTGSASAYTAALYKIKPGLIANAGVRYTKSTLKSFFREKSFFPFPYDEIQQSSSVFTGNAGLVYIPDPSWRFSALVATGFRTPNVDDIAKVFESGNGNFIIPNPDLKPEKTLNYEISVRKKFGNVATIETTAWYTLFTDALTTDFATYLGSPTITYNGIESLVLTTVNKNKADLYGGTATLTVDLFKHFSFSGSFNYTYGRIREAGTKYPLDHVPPIFGRCGIIYNRQKFSTEFFVMYNGAKDSTDYNLRGEDNHAYSADVVRGFTPAWATFNFRTNVNIEKGLSVQFAIENLADRFYRAFASGISAPGRNFIFSLRTEL